MKWDCHLCREELESGDLEEVVDHVRTMHPERFEEPERWPDGGLVIHESDPDPL